MIHKSRTNSRHGFTIVEVLVVVMVIAILAAITIVSYTAVTESAKKRTVKTDALTIASQLNKHKADKGSYPTELNDLSDTSGLNSTFQYSYNATAATYCLTASVKGASAYVKSGSSVTTEGGCPGHGVNGETAVTNLMHNPGVRIAATGWSVGAAGSTGTQARVATGGPAGVTGSFYRRTNTVAATSSPLSISTSPAGVNAIPVEGSTLYTVSMYARSSCVVSAGFRADYTPYNSAGSATSSVGGSLVKNTANTWHRLSHTFTTEADTAFIRPYVAYSGPQACSANSIFDATAVMLTKGDKLYTYGDGDSSNWIWNGTPSDSTSTGPAQ